MKVHFDAERILITKGQIAARVKALAKKLDEAYEGRIPLMVCILKGSLPFFADLIREMKGELHVDFMAVSSYGRGTKSTGELHIRQDLSQEIAGKDVVLVEDIVDSGNTLYKLKELLLSRNPASLRIVTLLDKPQRRVAPLQPDDVGFVIEDEFVIGYGLDYAEKYRNLPYVAILKRSIYE